MDTLDEAVRCGLEQVDADSWEEVCRAVPPDVVQTLQLSVARNKDVVLTSCLVNDAPTSNRALALGIGADCTEEMLVELKNHFMALGLKNFALQISPYARFAGAVSLSEALARVGLVERGSWLKLYRGSAPVAPVNTPFQVRKMAAGDGALFGGVCARGFGRPPIISHWMGATVGHPRWHHYLAYLGDEPAAAAAMYVDGAYAWFGFGSTVAAFRQQGAQSALIAQRIADALALGCRHLVAETEKVNASSQNLTRAGFQCIYQRPNYGIPAVSI